MTKTIIPGLLILLFVPLCHSQLDSIGTPVMGLHVNKSATPFPSVAVRTQRLWDTQTTWAQLNPCNPAGASNVAEHPPGDPQNDCLQLDNA